MDTEFVLVDQYDNIRNRHQSLRNNGGRQIEWWKEEGDYLDIEKS